MCMVIGSHTLSPLLSRTCRAQVTTLGHINLITRFSSPPAPTFECWSDADKINRKRSCQKRISRSQTLCGERPATQKMVHVFVICQIPAQSSTNFLSSNVFLESSCRSSPMETDQTIHYKQLPTAPGRGSPVDENLVICFMWP